MEKVKRLSRFMLILTIVVFFVVFAAACGNTDTVEDPPDGNDQTETPGGDDDEKPGDGDDNPDNPETPTAPDGTVSEFVIVTAPDTLEYYPGEMADLAGMTLKATWSNGYVENVPLSECAVAPGRALTADDKAVTVTYEGKSVSQPVTVKAVDVVNTAFEGFVINPNEGGVYRTGTGQALDFGGLTVTVTYSDEATRVLPYTVTADGKDVADISAISFSSAGRHEVTIKCMESSHSVPVEVINGIVIDADNIAEDAASARNSVEVYNTETPETVPYGSKSVTSGSTGQRYLGKMIYGATAKFHIYSESARKVTLKLYAANTNVTKGGTNPKNGKPSGWYPTEIADSVFNDYAAVRFGTGDNLTEVSVGADVVLSGSTAPAPGDQGLLEKWQEIVLGEFDLAEGDNILEVTSVNNKKNKQLNEKNGFNYDRLEVVFG